MYVRAYEGLQGLNNSPPALKTEESHVSPHHFPPSSGDSRADRRFGSFWAPMSERVAFAPEAVDVAAFGSPSSCIPPTAGANEGHYPLRMW